MHWNYSGRHGAAMDDLEGRLRPLLIYLDRLPLRRTLASLLKTFLGVGLGCKW